MSSWLIPSWLITGYDTRDCVKFDDDCPSFPPSIKVLVLLFKKSTSPGFPFTLQILPKVFMKVKSKSWWHFWTTTLRPKKGHHGWSCNIKANYHPDIAKSIIHEYEKPVRRKSQIVGLARALADCQ